MAPVRLGLAPWLAGAGAATAAEPPAVQHDCGRTDPASHGLTAISAILPRHAAH